MLPIELEVSAFLALKGEGTDMGCMVTWVCGRGEQMWSMPEITFLFNSSMPVL
jgi:hypothetical protein